MTTSRGFRPYTPRRPWTADEDETMRLNFPKFPCFVIAYLLDRGESGIYQRARALGLRKVPNFYRQWHTPLWSKWDHSNQVANRFKKGQTPPNKGTRRPGYAPGRMAETQFRKGQRPHTWLPVGSERVTYDGIRERKINDLPGNNSVRWKGVHILVWQATNGPVPKGHIVRFRDGMHTTETNLITIDRLELIDRRENLRRNSLHNYPKEIVRATMMRGALNRVINRQLKDATP